MKKIILILVILSACFMHAATDWKPKGIYIVNQADGQLTIRWDEKGNSQERMLMPAPLNSPNQLSALHIPQMAPGTKVTITFSDTAPAHADMHSCRGGSHLSFTTNNQIVLYEIRGGFDAIKVRFNQPATGNHCHIELQHQRFNAQRALEKYPILAGNNYLPEQ